MTTAAGTRPRKVTLACLLAGVGALLATLGGISEMADWGSIQQREQLDELLSREPYSRAGLSIDEALELMRISIALICVVGAVTVVLAIWTFRGHRGTRMLLTILAAASGVIFLLLGVAGILAALMAFVTVFYLWSPESRAWFAGRPYAPGSSTSGRGASADPFAVQPYEPPAAPPPPPPPSAPVAPVGPPVAGSGPPPSDRPYGAPVDLPGTAVAGAPLPARPGRTPRAVVVAVIVTSVIQGLVALLCGLTALVYLVTPEAYQQALEAEPMVRQSDALAELDGGVAGLARLIFYMAMAGFVLAAAHVVAALLMLRRSAVARIALTVLSAVTIVVSLLVVLTAPVALLWTAGTAFVLYECYRPDVNAWFRSPR